MKATVFIKGHALSHIGQTGLFVARLRRRGHLVQLGWCPLKRRAVLFIEYQA